MKNNFFAEHLYLPASVVVQKNSYSEELRNTSGEIPSVKYFFNKFARLGSACLLKS